MQRGHQLILVFQGTFQGSTIFKEEGLNSIRAEQISLRVSVFKISCRETCL